MLFFFPYLLVRREVSGPSGVKAAVALGLATLFRFHEVWFVGNAARSSPARPSAFSAEMADGPAKVVAGPHAACALRGRRRWGETGRISFCTRSGQCDLV